MNGQAGTLFVALLLALTARDPSAWASAAEPTGTERRSAFLEHVGGLHQVSPDAVAAVRELAAGASPDQAFLPDALARINPSFHAALEHYDAGDYAAAAHAFARLLDDNDPYVASNAGWFHARALVAAGREARARAIIADLLARDDSLARYTPFVPHLWLLRAHTEAADLDDDEARTTLHQILDKMSDAPEAVRMAARQLMLELQQRPTDDLGAVATLMDFSARRLDAGDMREPVRNRQERIVTLLDKLIEEAQQREQQQSRQPRAAQAPQRPRQGAEESRLPPTAEGRIGQLNRPPQASPGEAWGKLPPAEREEILQSLRERYPSRYRHLVEQYYRALADEE